MGRYEMSQANEEIADSIVCDFNDARIKYSHNEIVQMITKALDVKDQKHKFEIDALKERIEILEENNMEQFVWDNLKDNHNLTQAGMDNILRSVKKFLGGDYEKGGIYAHKKLID